MWEVLIVSGICLEIVKLVLVYYVLKGSGWVWLYWLYIG